MNQYNLPENHKRTLTAALFVVENLVTELQQELQHPHKKVLTRIVQTDEDIPHMLAVIGQVQQKIAALAKKYQLPHTTYQLSQIVNARKTKIWEILCDTRSDKMKGYGAFPAAYAAEFDQDIDDLLRLTESI